MASLSSSLLAFLLCCFFRLGISESCQYQQTTCSANNSCNTNSTKVDLSLCPVLFQCKNFSKCECANKLDWTVLCSEHLQEAAVMDCHCITYDSNKRIVMSGLCLAQCGVNREGSQDNNAYYKISKRIENLNSSVCGKMNRDGFLCGKCKHNFYPQGYSYDLTCIHENECKGKHGDLWKYILVAYGPLTMFCFVILLFRINITSSYLLAYIVFSQTITNPYLVRPVFSLTSQNKKIHLGLQILSSINSIWNLNFFKNYNICLKLDGLTIVALDYCIAVYPFLLTFVSYKLIKIYDRKIPFITAIWRPLKYLLSFFHKKTDSHTTVMDAYISFFLLSYAKIANVSFTLLMPTKLYSAYTNESKLVLFYDGTKEYFHKEHLPYGLLAITMCCLFNLLPFATLLFYHNKWFQFLLSLLPCKTLALRTTMDMLQCCYKDGSEPGTRDCRWFLATFLSYWMVTYLCYATTLDSMFYIYGIIYCIMFLVFLVTVQPYKNKYFHYFQLHYASFVCLAVLFLIGAALILAFLAENDSVLNNLYISIAIFFMIPNVFIITRTFYQLMC